MDTLGILIPAVMEPAEGVQDVVQFRASCSAIGPSVVPVADCQDEKEDDDDRH